MKLLSDWPAIYSMFANQFKELYHGPTVYISLHICLTCECQRYSPVIRGLLNEFTGIDPLLGLAALKV